MWREYETGTNEIVEERKENNDSKDETLDIVLSNISNGYFTLYNDNEIQENFLKSKTKKLWKTFLHF